MATTPRACRRAHVPGTRPARPREQSQFQRQLRQSSARPEGRQDTQGRHQPRTHSPSQACGNHACKDGNERHSYEVCGKQCSALSANKVKPPGKELAVSGSGPQGLHLGSNFCGSWILKVWHHDARGKAVQLHKTLKPPEVWMPRLTARTRTTPQCQPLPKQGLACLEPPIPLSQGFATGQKSPLLAVGPQSTGRGSHSYTVLAKLS